MKAKKQKVNTALCQFQLGCLECWTSLSVISEEVKVKKNGEPYKSEAKRIFDSPSMKHKSCWSCGNEDLHKEYMYPSNSVPAINEFGDLPF